MSTVIDPVVDLDALLGESALCEIAGNVHRLARVSSVACSVEAEYLISDCVNPSGSLCCANFMELFLAHCEKYPKARCTYCGELCVKYVKV